MVTARCPADAAVRAARIALVVTDNDGVLTDGTVHVSASGEDTKVYSVRDGMGVERLRQRGIATAVITREPPLLIAPRARKLEIGGAFREFAEWLLDLRTAGVQHEK